MRQNSYLHTCVLYVALYHIEEAVHKEDVTYYVGSSVFVFNWNLLCDTQAHWALRKVKVLSFEAYQAIPVGKQILDTKPENKL